MKNYLSSVLTMVLLQIICLFTYVDLSAASPPITATEKKVDSLFILASSGELKYRDLVTPAKDSLAAMGKSAVPRLIEKFDTQVARERHAIDEILVKIGAVAVPYLIKTMADADGEKTSRICYTLGNIKDSSAVESLVGVASDSDWRVRSSAVEALGKIKDDRADKAVAGALTDNDAAVRKSAAVACGQLKIAEAIPHLVHMLSDDFYGARMCASETLVGFGETAIGPITDSLNSPDELLGNLGCTTLGMIGGDSAAVILGLQIGSPSPIRRALAVEGIYHSGSHSACGFVEILAQMEKDPMVLFFIKRAIEKYAAR